MAAYSVISRDDDPNDDADAQSGGPSVLSYVRATLVDEPQPVDETGHGDQLANFASPEIILQLPDLSAMDELPTGWWAGQSNRLFWIGIVLVALVALVLIWNPKKPPPVELDAAPAWGESTSAAQTSAAPPHVGVNPAPAHDPQPAGWPAEVRTARHGDTAWDGKSPDSQPGHVHGGETRTRDAQPSEALPTGRIINTLVPE